LSADIDAIAPGEGGFACCCNPAGRVLALLLVMPEEDRTHLVVSAGLTESTQTWLARFVLRADVQITARNDLFVATAGAADAPSAAFGPVEPVNGLSYVLLDEPLPDLDTEHKGADLWKAAELQSGVVWLDEASSGQFLPQMLGFEGIGALNFRKGCFPGQEIIARTRYLGKLKRRPLVLHAGLEQPLPVMQKLSIGTAGEPVSGVLVDQAPDSAGGHWLFVVVRSADELEPQSLEVDGESLTLL
ncbi:MAG TPA: hypothetical protein VK830_07230, partial [Xanthomonadales bacterium]|nr:hypothetical protein [Xanthomonadales bacterium]